MLWGPGHCMYGEWWHPLHFCPVCSSPYAPTSERASVPTHAEVVGHLEPGSSQPAVAWRLGLGEAWESIMLYKLGIRGKLNSFLAQAPDPGRSPCIPGSELSPSGSWASAVNRLHITQMLLLIRLSCPGCLSSLFKFPYVLVALQNNTHLFFAILSWNQPEATFIEPHLSSEGLWVKSQRSMWPPFLLNLTTPNVRMEIG